MVTLGRSEQRPNRKQIHQQTRNPERT